MRTRSEVIVTCDEDYLREPLLYKDLDPGSYFKFVNSCGLLEGELLKKVGTENLSYHYLYFSVKTRWHWSSTTYVDTLHSEVVLYDVCLRATRASY